MRSPEGSLGMGDLLGQDKQDWEVRRKDRGKSYTEAVEYSEVKVVISLPTRSLVTS